MSLRFRGVLVSKFVTFVYFCSSISTVSPADYEEVSVTLSFEECEERQCVGISVVDDLINEPVETLSLSLTANPELHLTLHTQTSEVAILDDDGKNFAVLLMSSGGSVNPCEASQSIKSRLFTPHQNRAYKTTAEFRYCYLVTNESHFQLHMLMRLRYYYSPPSIYGCFG